MQKYNYFLKLMFNYRYFLFKMCEIAQNWHIFYIPERILNIF